jgi:hypothetical protein
MLSVMATIARYKTKMFELNTLELTFYHDPKVTDSGHRIAMSG